MNNVILLKETVIDMHVANGGLPTQLQQAVDNYISYTTLGPILHETLCADAKKREESGLKCPCKILPFKQRLK